MKRMAITRSLAGGGECAHPPGEAAIVEEQELARRATKDRTAFGELYVRYAQRIFRYLCSRTETPDDAADLTQQTFTRALSALEKYRVGTTPFSAWIFRIAMNAATDLGRRRGRTVPLELATNLATSSTDPAALAVLSDERRRLQVLVKKLPEPERELLALRFAGGLTSREIAVLGGRSEEAVKKHLWRILRVLREQYDDHTP